MAIRSVASSNGFLPFTATAPAGTVAGDRLLAFVSTDVLIGLTTPSGWTAKLAPFNNFATGGSTSAVYEVISTTGAESFTWGPSSGEGCEVTIFAITGSTGGASILVAKADSTDYAGPTVAQNEFDLIFGAFSDVYSMTVATPALATDVISIALTTNTSTPTITFSAKYDITAPVGASTKRTMSTSVALGIAAMTVGINEMNTLITKVPPTGVMGFADVHIAVPVNPSATLTTLGGPTSGSTGVASSNFTVEVDYPVAGTVTITPNSGGGGGTFTPTSLAFSGGTVSGTFTYTAPAGSGDATRTIGITNDGGLLNPPTVDYFARDAAYAVADIVVTGWDPTAPVVTPLASVIDEAAADDGDYIQSPVINGSQGPAVFQLNKPLAAGSLTVPIRARFIGTAGQVRVLLTDDANTIWGTSAWQVLTGAFSLYSLSVTTSGTSTRIRLEVQ